MPFTLGIDIGTFESKGVLVDETGRIVAQAAHPHDMIVPRAGWAEHRADEDWWGDFVFIAKQPCYILYFNPSTPAAGLFTIIKFRLASLLELIISL